MPSYVWLALAASLAIVAGTTLFAVSRGLAAWRAFRRLRRRVFEGLGDLTRRVAGIEQRLSAAGQTAVRFDRARTDLQESLATASVLAGAFGEARAVVGRVTGLVPRK